MRGRRRCLAPLTSQAYETLVGDTLLESYCACRGEDLVFFGRGSLADVRRRRPDHRLVRLARTAPLSVRDRGRWVVFEL